ncbi:MAG TPA: enolase C-terminal domain-like protein [Gammaproteobacteria bacterium]|nr:enolase C-terminal domain-like protein [Gammaproteobacteria bacterium]
MKPQLTIRDLRCRAVSVPIARPLVTRVVTVDRVRLLLIDLLTEEGITGSAYLFGYLARSHAYFSAVLRDIGELTRGAALAPAALYERVRQAFTLMGHGGIAAMAAAGFDMACWDALAKAAGLPLASLLGAVPQPVKAYNSNGLGLIGADEAGAQAQELLAEGGFDALKARLGRATWADDLAAVRAIRAAVGEQVLLPVDFNQALTRVQALRRCRALDREGIYWIEEPIVYDDLAGCVALRREIATPIQLGENFYRPRAVADAIAAGACDYMMFDVMRIGGVTGWLRAAALAEAAGIEVSSHLMPEVSAHLLAAMPTGHWLEYVDWANPILAEPLQVREGHVALQQTPGTGIAWNEEAVARYQVEL